MFIYYNNNIPIGILQVGLGRIKCMWTYCYLIEIESLFPEICLYTEQSKTCKLQDIRKHNVNAHVAGILVLRKTKNSFQERLILDAKTKNLQVLIIIAFDTYIHKQSNKLCF